MGNRTRIFTCASLLLLVLFTHSAEAATSRSLKTQKQLSAEKVIIATNEERAKYKLPPLVTDAKLTMSAQTKAEEMAALGLFAHAMPDGRRSWNYVSAAGYDYQHAGENLAVHFVSEDALVNAWMKSPTHRKNILDRKFEDVGVGLAYGTFSGHKGYLVVQHLGKKQQY